MAYRNDLEALEARQHALDAELAERVRERDEVARMIGEARTREDRLRRGPERRRNERSVALAVIATTILVVAGTCIGVILHARSTRLAEVVARINVFSAEMCVCTTQECAERVNDSMLRWAQQSDSLDILAVSDPDNDDRITELVEPYARCMTTAMTNATN